MTMVEDRGHYRCYIKKKFGQAAMDVIKAANDIILEYESKGMPLTLRQLYYQFVARDLFANNVGNYNKLGNLISDGRLAGLVSWTAIEDRGRNLQGINHYTSPSSAIKSVLDNYSIDKWDDQRFRPEVWVEKAALEGVIGHICHELQVDFFATRGYNSQSEQWRAGRRFARYVSKGQTPIVFHLGDHDPSGIDMTRDNQERLSLFAGVNIQVIRLALNMDQIRRYEPPPNPAKMTDSRYVDYAEKYGEKSWELDALEPTVIHNLIRDAVLGVRDQKLWNEALAQELDDKIVLEDMINETGENDKD